MFLRCNDVFNTFRWWKKRWKFWNMFDRVYILCFVLIVPRLRWNRWSKGVLNFISWYRFSVLRRRLEWNCWSNFALRCFSWFKIDSCAVSEGNKVNYCSSEEIVALFTPIRNAGSFVFFICFTSWRYSIHKRWYVSGSAFWRFTNYSSMWHFVFTTHIRAWIELLIFFQLIRCLLSLSWHEEHTLLMD